MMMVSCLRAAILFSSLGVICDDPPAVTVVTVVTLETVVTVVTVETVVTVVTVVLFSAL